MTDPIRPVADTLRGVTAVQRLQRRRPRDEREAPGRKPPRPAEPRPMSNDETAEEGGGHVDLRA